MYYAAEAFKKMIGEFPSETQLQHQSVRGKKIKWYRNK